MVAICKQPPSKLVIQRREMGSHEASSKHVYWTLVDLRSGQGLKEAHISRQTRRGYAGQGCCQTRVHCQNWL
jgi:hypothetical protein